MLKASLRVIKRNKVKFILSLLAVIIVYASSMVTRSGGGVGGELLLLIGFMGYWGYQIDRECDAIDQEEVYEKMILKNQIM